MSNFIVIVILAVTKLATHDLQSSSVPLVSDLNIHIRSSFKKQFRDADRIV